MIQNGISRRSFQQVEGDLRARISRHEWMPGEKIDSCRKLAEQYSCSINTIQKALKNLEISGLILREERKGILVSDRVDIRKGTGLVAAFVPQIDNPLWVSALRGIEDYLHNYGYSMVSGSHDLSSDRLRQTVDNLHDIPIDGMILSPLNQTEEESQWFRSLIKSRMANSRIVLMDRFLYDLDVPYVTTDNINASYKLTRILLDSGHRDMAFVSGKSHISTVEERYTGFRQACYDAGPTRSHFFRFQVSQTKEDFRDEMDLFCDQLTAYLDQHPVTALFAANDQIARAILITLERLGKRVPDDISLVSYDVENLADTAPLKITGVRQNFYEMGKMAANVLLNSICTAQPKQNMQLGTIVPSDIIMGNSVQKRIP